MVATGKVSDAAGGDRLRRYLQWGGAAAILGPLLVLVANGYAVWLERTHGVPEGLVEVGTTVPFQVFAGIRLVGAIVFVVGLVALYLAQLEAAGRLGLLGFCIAMIGSLLLMAVAWFEVFVVPVLVAEAPELLTAVVTGETGGILAIGAGVPIFIQAIGWIVFGIATYRATVFPRRASIVLTLGAALLFVPVQGVPVVFQLAMAWLGLLLLSGRVEPVLEAPQTPSGEPA